MPNKPACPPKHDLERLMLGQFAEAETSRLADHIEACDQCVETVRTLAPNDTLVAAMKHSPSAATDLPTGEEVQKVITHLRGLVGQTRADETKTTETGPSNHAVSSADLPSTIAGDASRSAVNPDAYDFLAPPQSPDELGRLGSYRVLKVLGAGGMGVVFLAEDPHLERQVALKVMKPVLAASESEKKRFLREARTAAAIEHDHIVGIYQVGQDRGVPYLAMPLLRGESLEDRLQRDGKLSLDETLRVGREIAEGLAVAHGHGLMHRDIKPGNIWLEHKAERRTLKSEDDTAILTGSHTAHVQTSPRVKILDFGLARAADDSAQLTQPGAIAGTPAYMAPEQIHGETIDQRCDLFSLGCVLYRCATGRPPFEGKNAMTVLMAVTQSQPKPVRECDPSLPPEIEKLILRLLEKHPAHRFQTADEVVSEISRIERRQSAMKQQAASATTPMSASESTQLSALGNGVPVRPPWRVKAIAGGGLFALLVTLAVYVIQTDKGTLVVSIDDDTIEAKLKQNGLAIQDTQSGRSFTIKSNGEQQERSGAYKLADGQGLKLIVMDDAGLEVSTNEFKLTRGGRVRVRVTSELSPTVSKPQPSAGEIVDADRRVAEWVLSIGGKITLDSDPQHFIAKGDPLPAGPWKLVSIGLTDNMQVTDDDFDRFAELTELQHIYADNTLITDAALAKIKHLTKLYTLMVSHSVSHRPRGPVITDAGLAHLKNMKELRNLALGGARQVTDKGLANLRDHAKLVDVGLDYSTITDDGLDHLKNSSATLQVLKLSSTAISDKGLEHLSEMKHLRHLSLGQTRVTDGGLKHLNCAGLTDLNLGRTGVTDVGLDELKRFTKLTYLNVGQTKVTAEGVQKFHQALPQCRIRSDYGVFEPSADANREAAEWLLRIGGAAVITVNGESRAVRNQADLPQSAFVITNINTESKMVSDADLECLEGLAALKVVWIRDAPITDIGLAHVLGSTGLVEIAVERTKISDESLVRCRDLSKLRSLHLAGTAITDNGLQHLKGLNLTNLNINDTQVADTGLKVVQGMTNMDELQISHTKATDVGLEHLKGLDKLRWLRLDGTRISDAGLVNLNGKKGLHLILLDDTQVTDAGLGNLRESTDLLELYLNRTQVTDAGLKQLTGMKKLRVLELQSTHVTDAGLADLKEIRSLAHIALQGTKVTDAGVADLKAALPQCNITR